MPVDVVLESPLAHALNEAIQPKLVEVGWSTGGVDDSALTEYIILMLVNGKPQDAIAAELSGDLLNLGPDDPGARDFARWLFEQVAVLDVQLGAGGFPADSTLASNEVAKEVQDAEMGDSVDAGQANVPTGPKSMRDGGRPRDKRMLGHLAKAMDRSNDNVLHRVRPHNGTERINSHSRGPPTGPRQSILNRGGTRMPNGPRHVSMSGPQPSATAMNMMNMTPQNQMAMLASLEQQMKGMAQMMQMGMNGQMPMANGMQNNFNQHQGPRKSLFERVQPKPRGHNNSFRGGQAKFGEKHHEMQSDPPSSSMDVEMSQEKRDPPSADDTCKYNLSCTNKDCKFAHQSPAAPPGTSIDLEDECSFGAACKNRKCTGRHPSPAQRLAHQTTMDCKFYPNCTNERCPFRHPSVPPCRNGADCTTLDCKFVHSKVMCKFNPCLNPSCVFKHVDGQKRGKFEDKVWVANGAKEHVSERKFVDESNEDEELIKPEMEEENLNVGPAASVELVT
ncbi:nuclear polyadenylated RNA-binding protein-like protein Nab2 [Amylocarpus encephaloides]|uniref:Nuclear polyadenylated RNA-binding protein-like protein Nab2 n=1 Tax=Amylocarpus encephaloides TaxID=45428 RepID=A0A9P7YSV6_9HELO|nr:nuclear polyadenylated RNA-binding protein-like protein Nab2 [Amylocarpus encephaloides]